MTLASSVAGTQRRDDLRAAADVVAHAFGDQCGVVGTTSYGSQSINLKSLTLVRVGPVFSKQSAGVKVTISIVARQ